MTCSPRARVSSPRFPSPRPRSREAARRPEAGPRSRIPGPPFRRSSGWMPVPSIVEAGLAGQPGHWGCCRDWWPGPSRSHPGPPGSWMGRLPRPECPGSGSGSTWQARWNRPEAVRERVIHPGWWPGWPLAGKDVARSQAREAGPLPFPRFQAVAEGRTVARSAARAMVFPPDRDCSKALTESPPVAGQ